MELVVAAIATSSASFLGYRCLRRYTNSTVNCWFCNENSKVSYTKINSFDCLKCGQYNGFTESGDYNKRIPGQQTFGSISQNGRFCLPSKSTIQKNNGLCDSCNIKQATIMKQIADFEPINEDRWEEELEEFKYKLDKVYALCSACSIYTHKKLEDDKLQFGYLLKLRDRFMPTVNSACRNVAKLASRVTHRHRRKFFSGGRFTEVFHFLTLLLTTTSFFSNLHYLQEDADVEFISFPLFVQPVLPYLLQSGMYILLVSLFSHIIAFCKNKNRTTLPDLIYPMVGTLLLFTYFLSEEKYHEDLVLFRCAFTSFMIVLSAAVTFVPRKKLHKKRPNKVFNSAFSVASTPASQCSTVSDSLLDSDEERSSTPPLVKNRMIWRERQQSPEPTSSKLTEKSHEESMDWETSTVHTAFSDRSTSSTYVPPRFTGLRETTPARELAPSLSSLSLANGSVFKRPTLNRFSPKSQVFPSFTSDIVTDRLTPTVFHSNRGPASMSAFTSVSKRTLRRMNDSPNLPEPSVFTSISQQQGSSMSALMKMFVGSLILSSLLGNIAFFYFIFRS